MKNNIKIGGLFSYFLGIAGFFIIFLLIVILSGEVSEVYAKGRLDWYTVLIIFLLLLINTIFCLLTIWILKSFLNFKAMKHVKNLKEVSMTMAGEIIPSFNGNKDENQKSLSKGIVENLNEVTVELGNVYEKLKSYEKATEFVRNNIVIFGSEQESMLGDFFNDSILKEELIKEIQFIGTGRGAMGGKKTAYNFYGNLTNLFKIKCDNNQIPIKFKCIGSIQFDEQMCLRAFVYRLVYFVLKYLNENDIKISSQGFKISFKLLHNFIFPAQLTMGKLKSLIAIPLHDDDAKAIMNLIPIGLQLLGSKYNNNKYNLDTTIEMITESFNEKYDNHQIREESWHFQRSSGSIDTIVEFNGLNNLGIISKIKRDHSYTVLIEQEKIFLEDFFTNNNNQGKLGKNDLETLNTLWFIFAILGHGREIAESLRNE